VANVTTTEWYPIIVLGNYTYILANSDHNPRLNPNPDLNPPLQSSYTAQQLFASIRGKLLMSSILDENLRLQNHRYKTRSVCHRYKTRSVSYIYDRTRFFALNLNSSKFTNYKPHRRLDLGSTHGKGDLGTRLAPASGLYPPVYQWFATHSVSSEDRNVGGQGSSGGRCPPCLFSRVALAVFAAGPGGCVAGR